MTQIHHADREEIFSESPTMSRQMRAHHASIVNGRRPLRMAVIAKPIVIADLAPRITDTVET